MENCVHWIITVPPNRLGKNDSISKVPESRLVKRLSYIKVCTAVAVFLDRQHGMGEQLLGIFMVHGQYTGNLHGC